MLTKKENLLETLHGGSPDRFVNQFSFLSFVSNPIRSHMGCFLNPGETGYDGWGVRYIFPENTPGTFPDNEGEHRVLKDITEWKTCVKAPKLDYPAEDWAPFVRQEAEIDRKEVFAATWVAPGILERLHSLMGMEDTMLNFYAEPEAMHDLIAYIADWEIAYAGEVVRHMRPEALFHHDDWGSQISSFISPEMFEEFLEPAYTRIYGFWKAHGVQIIVHHSDSYAANLVPSMIRMGIDIWQGPIAENNFRAVIDRYGGKPLLMGGLNNGIYDTPDCTSRKIRDGLKDLIDTCQTRRLIPALTMGGPESIYPGVYDMVSKEVDRLSETYF